MFIVLDNFESLALGGHIIYTTHRLRFCLVNIIILYKRNIILLCSTQQLTSHVAVHGCKQLNKSTCYLFTLTRTNRRLISIIFFTVRRKEK